jgi:hemerythrin-like domain-containing protein
MLRDPSLIPLSHQHQHALALCVRIDRALLAAGADLAAWQLEVHQLYVSEVQFHFAAEEKVLFPAARRFPELAPLVEELSSEHRHLKEFFIHAERGAMNQAELGKFPELLSAHIRKEERQLFEGMQQRMDAEQLSAIGIELTRALEDAVQQCRLSSGRK